MRTKADYLRVGRYFKRVDPETVKRLKDEGNPVDLETLGRWVEMVDEDMFEMIIAGEGV